MRKIGLTIALLAVGVVALVDSTGTAGGSAPGHVRAVLNGYQEVVGGGAISTVGDGVFTATIDESDQTISYELTYSTEGGTVLFSHIHFARRGVSGGIAAFLCGGGDKPPCPTPGGTVTGVIDAADVIGPTGQGIEPGSFEELVRAIGAGATYANVHTNRWPGGEIRGQIADNDSDDGK